MISDALVRAATNAARALASGVRDTGFTSNGLRKLDFVVKENGKQKVLTAIEQNPNKLSTPAKLAREGHRIIQIRDNDASALLGNVDVTENRFNSYENIPQPIDIDDIEKALGDNAVREKIPVTAARTASPVGEQVETSPFILGRNNEPQPTPAPTTENVQGPQGPEFSNRPGRASFEPDSGKKVA